MCENRVSLNVTMANIFKLISFPGEHDNSFELTHFRKFRFNRVQRQYDNVWLWKDVNIGPHGRYVFSVDVPRTPAQWTVSAFGMSPERGLGLVRHTQQVNIRVTGLYVGLDVTEGKIERRMVIRHVDISSWNHKYLLTRNWKFCMKRHK